MGERPVTDVMQQNGSLYGFRFTVEDEVSFRCQLRDSFSHQVESTQGMLEAGVLRTWIYHRREPYLLDTGKTLQKGMPYYIV